MFWNFTLVILRAMDILWYGLWILFRYQVKAAAVFIPRYMVWLDFIQRGFIYCIYAFDFDMHSQLSNQVRIFNLILICANDYCQENPFCIRIRSIDMTSHLHIYPISDPTANEALLIWMNLIFSISSAANYAKPQTKCGHSQRMTLRCLSPFA